MRLHTKFKYVHMITYSLFLIVDGISVVYILILQGFTNEDGCITGYVW